MECITRNMLGKFIGCSVNPRAGREREALPMPAVAPKKVLVIGGGPGGMESARIAAGRGHDVTLVEKDQTLGGHLVEACVPPFKRLLASYASWLERQTQNSRVKVQTGVKATLEWVQKMNPDVIFLASGSTPLVPDVPGLKGKKVVQAVDFLRGKAKIGPKVVVIGGGLVGCEAASCLAGEAESITILEMLPDILMDVSVFSRFTLMARLRAAGIKWAAGRKLREVKENGVVAQDPAGQEEFFAAETVVLATGFAANDGLYETLEKEGYEVYRIGDCLAPRKIIDAVQGGYLIAREL
jgi:2-enoate reductase